MSVQQRLAAGMLLVVVVASAGFVEAIRIGEPSLATLFGAVAVIAGSAAASCSRRTVMALRGDLARWADRTSAATGEPAERLVDRAVSAYRLDFESSPGGDRTDPPDG